MYKIAVFILVIISLSIVTVGASLIWDRGFKRSGPPVDLQNDIALDSFTNIRPPAYNAPFDEGQKDLGQGVEKVVIGNEIPRSRFSSVHTISNDVEFDPSPSSESIFYRPQSEDVDATQEHIASSRKPPSVNSTSRGSSPSRRGGRGSGGSGPSRATTSGGGPSPAITSGGDPNLPIISDGDPPLPIISGIYPPGHEPLDHFPGPPIRDNFGPSSSPAPVPEPATMLLFGAGLAGLAGYRLRRKKS